ncbi:hypothetical protein LCGC14_0982160 [marine sediment metagenome]|uniref:Uncharacterized protein n=1 Tax=marine sediment metagenome TaxID=412755 RepID=A0A0F9NCX3_9ZZZZ
MEKLIEALRELGLNVDLKRSHEGTVRITPDSMSLMWDRKSVICVRFETTTFCAEALDEPGEDDELIFERLVIERYR